MVLSHNFFRLLLIALFLQPCLSLSQQTDDLDDRPQASGIVTWQLGADTIEEYRVSGRTRTIKVIPQQGGIPYYMLDADGDGELSVDTETEGSSATGWQIMDW